MRFWVLMELSSSKCSGESAHICANSPEHSLLHTQIMVVDEYSGQNLDGKPTWAFCLFV